MTEYTDSLPVLSHDLIAQWKAAGHSFADRIYLSDRPDVFRNYCPNSDSLYVWRPEMPAKIKDFIEANLRLPGTEIARSIHKRFLSFENICLSNKKLYRESYSLAHRSPLVSADISTLWSDAKFAEGAHLFAGHILNSLRDILMELPAKAKLRGDPNNTANFGYMTLPSGLEPHWDGEDILMMHGSDPGTPYLFDRPKPFFRTAAGDITLHTSDVMHDFATSPGSPEKGRNRMMLMFRALDLNCS